MGEVADHLAACEATLDLMLRRPGLDDHLRADVEELRVAAHRLAGSLDERVSTSLGQAGEPGHDRIEEELEPP